MDTVYNRVEQKDVDFFSELLNDRCKTDLETRQDYGHDETEDLLHEPDIVLFPEKVEEVSAILKYCNDGNIAVTPIGARTGLSGGALSVARGVGMCLERMNRILKIDEHNHQVWVEPGVITQVLQETVAEKGLYYAPDPASRGTCFIGGNIAENSGGPHAVKYGVTSDFVLNLEVVLPDGRVMWTGANTLKNATGYNLTQLFVGSEGTLGVVTKAVLKLLPIPSLQRLLLVPFFSAEDACKAVAEFFKAGVTPSAMEFMERDAIVWTLDFMESDMVIPENVQAHLLIEVDGNDEQSIMNDLDTIMQVLDRYQTDEILFAESEAQKDKLWKVRRRVGEAVKSKSIYKEEDTVVPRYELPKLLNGVKAIGERYGFKSICYGHAGDGNLHINIIKGDMSDSAWNNELPSAIRELFELTVSLGGTISGEHGIGLVQKNYMDIAFKQDQLSLMKQIKSVFDPNGIMNPLKIFPEA